MLTAEALGEAGASSARDHRGAPTDETHGGGGGERRPGGRTAKVVGVGETEEMRKGISSSIRGDDDVAVRTRSRGRSVWWSLQVLIIDHLP